MIFNRIKNILKKIKEEIKKLGIIKCLILIIYMILIIIISLKHEFSQDETQSWLIARDLNFIDIIRQMKYEGHSFLWHFMLLPFAKLGFSINTQKMIPIFFSTLTVYTILKKAPFNLFIKILIIFSSGMIYYYSAFSRPYCLIPFLLVNIASIYNNKQEHPYKYSLLVALLAHTHLIMLPTACLLLLDFFTKELIINKKNNTQTYKNKLINCLFLSIFMISICVIISIISYFNCYISIVIREYNKIENKNFLINFLSTWRKTNAQFYGIMQIDNYISKYAPIYYDIIILFILLLCIIGFVKDKKQGCIFWSQYIFILIVHTSIWFILPVRILIIIYSLLFWCWVSKEKNNKFIEIALVILIVATLPGTYKCLYQDIIKQYAVGEEVATYIEDNIPKNSVFINVYFDYSQLISGYVNKEDYKFYMLNAKRFITYNTWDKRYMNGLLMSDTKKIVNKFRKKYKKIYILYPLNKESKFLNEKNLEQRLNLKLKKIYKTDLSKVIDNNYIYDRVYFYIYEIQ